MVYSTFDWGIRDKDGYYFILGRTDDVINVAGHRLGTREIEEAIRRIRRRRSRRGRRRRPAEGADAGRVRRGEGCSEDRHARGARGAGEGGDEDGGPAARRHRPAVAGAFRRRVLPKTRSGKVLRRSIQALAEGRDPGDLTTIEDPTALEQIRAALAGKLNSTTQAGSAT